MTYIISRLAPDHPSGCVYWNGRVHPHDAVGRANDDNSAEPEGIWTAGSRIVAEATALWLNTSPVAIGLKGEGLWQAMPLPDGAHIDFASRLAAEHGGIVKPGGERLAVVRRGAGTDAAGAELPRIRVTRMGSSGWNIEGEPRPRFGKVAAAWQDPASGRRKLAEKDAGSEGPTNNLIHPRATKAEAEAAAQARARELNTLTGAGFFVTEFDPTYSAGALVEASGFGEGIDGVWPSERISTSWEKGTPVLSTIDVTAKPEGGKTDD
jgi:hypothetical protein